MQRFCSQVVNNGAVPGKHGRDNVPLPVLLPSYAGSSPGRSSSQGKGSCLPRARGAVALFTTQGPAAAVKRWEVVGGSDKGGSWPRLQHASWIFGAADRRLFGAACRHPGTRRAVDHLQAAYRPLVHRRERSLMLLLGKYVVHSLCPEDQPKSSPRVERLR